MKSSCSSLTAKSLRLKHLRLPLTSLLPALARPSLNLFPCYIFPPTGGWVPHLECGSPAAAFVVEPSRQLDRLGAMGSVHKSGSAAPALHRNPAGPGRRPGHKRGAGRASPPPTKTAEHGSRHSSLAAGRRSLALSVSLLFPLHTRTGLVCLLFPLHAQKRGAIPPVENVGAPTFLIFLLIFRTFLWLAARRSGRPLQEQEGWASPALTKKNRTRITGHASLSTCPPKLQRRRVCYPIHRRPFLP